ncbi:MAG: hypothetical protein ACP6IS_12190 [Candidatus Asgardarchaeia archaeon]
METSNYIKMTIKVLNDILDDLDDILDHLDKTVRVNPAMAIFGLFIPPILLDRSKKEFLYSAKVMEEIRENIRKLKENIIDRNGEYLIPKTAHLESVLEFDYDKIIDKLYEKKDVYGIADQIKDLMKLINQLIEELKEIPY